MKYKLKIKNRIDGTFKCHTPKGRVIIGGYECAPGEVRPSMLWLSADTNMIDHEGQRPAAVSMYHVQGYLSTDRLTELVHQVEQRAESIERGDQSPSHVERVDMRTTETWQRFLRSHPQFLKQHPQYLADLKGDPEA